MRITVNGGDLEVPEGTTVAALIHEITAPAGPAASNAAAAGARACAAEVNRALVPRRDHAATALREGDVVELVTLVGGG